MSCLAYIHIKKLLEAKLKSFFLSHHYRHRHHHHYRFCRYYHHHCHHRVHHHQRHHHHCRQSEGVTSIKTCKDHSEPRGFW